MNYNNIEYRFCEGYSYDHLLTQQNENFKELKAANLRWVSSLNRSISIITECDPKLNLFPKLNRNRVETSAFVTDGRLTFVNLRALILNIEAIKRQLNSYGDIFSVICNIFNDDDKKVNDLKLEGIFSFFSYHTLHIGINNRSNIDISYAHYTLIMLFLAHRCSLVTNLPEAFFNGDLLNFLEIFTNRNNIGLKSMLFENLIRFRSKYSMRVVFFANFDELDPAYTDELNFNYHFDEGLVCYTFHDDILDLDKFIVPEEADLIAIKENDDYFIDYFQGSFSEQLNGHNLWVVPYVTSFTMHVKYYNPSFLRTENNFVDNSTFRFLFSQPLHQLSLNILMGLEPHSSPILYDNLMILQSQRGSILIPDLALRSSQKYVYSLDSLEGSHKVPQVGALVWSFDEKIFYNSLDRFSDIYLYDKDFTNLLIDWKLFDDLLDKKSFAVDYLPDSFNNYKDINIPQCSYVKTDLLLRYVEQSNDAPNIYSRICLHIYKKDLLFLTIESGQFEIIQTLYTQIVHTNESFNMIISYPFFDAFIHLLIFASVKFSVKIRYSVQPNTFRRQFLIYFTKRKYKTLHNTHYNRLSLYVFRRIVDLKYDWRKDFSQYNHIFKFSSDNIHHLMQSLMFALTGALIYSRNNHFFTYLFVVPSKSKFNKKTSDYRYLTSYVNLDKLDGIDIRGLNLRLPMPQQFLSYYFTDKFRNLLTTSYHEWNYPKFLRKKYLTSADKDIYVDDPPKGARVIHLSDDEEEEEDLSRYDTEQIILTKDIFSID